MSVGVHVYVQRMDVLYRCMMTVQHVFVFVTLHVMCVQTRDIIRELDHMFQTSSSLNTGEKA